MTSGWEILTKISGLPQHVFDPNARCSHPKKSELLGGTPQKAKAKTRPDGHTPSPMQESRRDSATSTEEKGHTEVKQIKVNKRAFKVFATMFHVPSANEQQNTGEIAWSEFLYSMKMIGFSVEKLYGSSWQFTPDTIDVQRSIQFHEPHPRAKIWYWLMKNFGRRLHRYVVISYLVNHLLMRTTEPMAGPETRLWSSEQMYDLPSGRRCCSRQTYVTELIGLVGAQKVERRVDQEA